MDVTKELDALVRVLQAAVRPVASDAIDIELARPPRETAVLPLGEAPEVVAFRNELVDGLIRADTANQLLRLVAMIVERLV
jgi:hypothetical protein